MTAAEGLPRLDVQIDGRVLDASNATAVTAVRVLHRLSLPSLCELSLQVPGTGLNNDRQLSIGSTLKVFVHGGDLLFEGELTGVHHAHTPTNGHELRVRGFDKLHRLRKRQSIRSFSGKTLAELVDHMANDDLVGWGWNPGEGREPVPGTQEQFGELYKAWAATGAHCPDS